MGQRLFSPGAAKHIPYVYVSQTASTKNVTVAPGKVADFLHMGQPREKVAQVCVQEEGRAEGNSVNLS